MAGHMVAVTPSASTETSLDGFASYDPATKTARIVFGGACDNPDIASRFARTPETEKRSRSTPFRIVTTRVPLASTRVASAATLAEFATTAAGRAWCQRSSLLVIGREPR